MPLFATRRKKKNTLWRPMLRYFRRSSLAYLRADKAEMQRQRRRLALHLLGTDAETITFRRDGTLWTAFAWDTQITKYLFSAGGYHTAEIKGLLSWLRARDLLPADRSVIVDVGANIGTTSVPLAQQTGRRIVAIEPVPENHALLRQNAMQNGLERQITCVHAAVASLRGSVEMVLNDLNCGGHEIRETGESLGFGAIAGSERVVQVPADTLSGLLSAQSVAPHQVALVWSDTQGCEAKVIESGRPLWQAGVPLYVELWPAGLAAHGGARALIAAANRNFDRFVTSDGLLASGANAEPQPIAELARVLDDLQHGSTDALLLPAASLQG